MKITVHKYFNPWYYNFYLEGLRKISSDISFDTLIPDEAQEIIHNEFPKDYFIFSVRKNNKERLIAIGADDKREFSSTLYDNSDAFGKVNTNEDFLKKYDKLMAIGPSFGIGNFSINTLKSFFNQFNTEYFSFDEWKKTFFRLPIGYYDHLRDKIIIKPNYIFYLNFPWSKHKELTEFRKEIIQGLHEFSKEGILEFEGGFSKRRLGYFSGLKDFSARKIYKHKDYLTQLAKSTVAINTPAVHDCLGWKLAEYLKLGKAIISFPINNSMPGDFKNNEHFHLVNNIKEFNNDLPLILNDRKYLKKLEYNAHNYFTNFLSSENSLLRLIDKSFEQ